MKNEMIEALNTADEYLEKLKNAIMNVSELIQEGKEQEAIHIIPEIAEGLDWLIQIVNLTINVQKEAININEVGEFIEQIVEAFENEDYILVGDLFNYEMLPLLENVHCEIKKNI